jgi:hypothetical protein
MATEFTEQVIREAPKIEALKVGLIKSAQDLTSQQLQLPAYQAAGLSPFQQRAMSLATQGIGSYAPFLQAGQQAVEAGIGTTGVGAQTLANLNVAPQFNLAQQMMQQAGQRVTSGMQGYDPNSVTQFMNPYQQQVTQQSLDQMRRQADIARQGQAAQAVGAGAFGGTREGVQRAEFERNVQDVMGQRAFQDYAANYAQAQQAAQQAFEAQQQRSLSGSQLYGQLGQGLGGLAAQYGQLGIQQGTGLGQMGQGFGQLGTQQAALGEAAQRLGLLDVNALSQLGQLQQGTTQAQLDAARATQLQQTMAPYQQLAFASDIYKGAPSSQISLTGTSAPSTSPLLQAAGLGVSGLAAATGAQKVGLFG